MASIKKGGRRSPSSAEAGRPEIRVNSEKVRELSAESMDHAVPQSKFSQWRAERRQSMEDARRQPARAVEEPQVQSSSRRLGARWKRWLYTLLSLLALAAIFVGVVFFSPLLAVRTITVEGTSLLDKSDVSQKLEPLQGVPLTRVTDDRVHELIGDSAVLRGVTVEARPPHDLLVKVQERVPVAVVKDGDQQMLVDAEGTKLRAVSSADQAGVPEVTGNGKVLGSPELKTISQVLQAMPADLLSNVQKAKADSPSTISLTMKDGSTVVWGTAEDSELKAKVLAQLRNALGDKGTVSTYDVSSPMVPTTK